MVGIEKTFPLIATDIQRWKRDFHATRRQESTLIVGGLALAASAAVLQKLLAAYNASASKAKTSENIAEDSGSNSSSEEPLKATSTDTEADSKRQKTKEGSKSESFFSSFGSAWFAKNFYDGGFEEKMTKREAALILGVRESAAAERIKDAHRRILILNHPDRGGSAFIAAKINEAKDLLMKGK